MTEQTHEYTFVTTLSAVARIRARTEDEALVFRSTNDDPDGTFEEELADIEAFKVEG